jgi:hypothetical protein
MNNFLRLALAAAGRITSQIVAIGVVVGSVLAGGLLSAAELSCTELNKLLGHSRSDFAAIRQSSINKNKGVETSLQLPGADHCTIDDNAEKPSYRCVWQFPIGAQQATVKFQDLVALADDCLINQAEKTKDQSVNHPDTYLAHIYRLSDAELRITFKHKSELRKTLVSLNLDSLNRD